jgi:carboxypeptidase C (cathepsin A)
LQGFAIGNGLTDPEIQYKAYTDYALEMKLIQNSDYDDINTLYPDCQNAIKRCGNHFLFDFLLILLGDCLLAIR